MIQIVGGTYLEYCREPHWFELFGSGLRAALALGSTQTPTKLLTLIGVDQEAVLQAKVSNIDLECKTVSETVVFEYLHPLSKPVVAPEPQLRKFIRDPIILEADGDKIVCFGIIEGGTKIKAKMAVYDPQSPIEARHFNANGSTAEKLAIVANRAEASLLSGISDDARRSCLKLAEEAEVAIVKCGAHGCLVGHKGHVTRVPAFKTKKVFPIGSGDVFTALFALAWMEKGLPPVEAATIASRGAAHYVETQAFPSIEDCSATDRQAIEPLEQAKRKQVYLAAPFFNLPQRWLVEEFRFSLQESGVEVFSPVHDVGRGDAAKVYGADIRGLEESGVVLACLDGLDPGTLYEVGYAHKIGLPVVAFVSAERDEDLKMLIGGGCDMTSDFATAFYLTVWKATCA